MVAADGPGGRGHLDAGHPGGGDADLLDRDLDRTLRRAIGFLAPGIPAPAPPPSPPAPASRPPVRRTADLTRATAAGTFGSATRTLRRGHGTSEGWV